MSPKEFALGAGQCASLESTSGWCHWANPCTRMLEAGREFKMGTARICCVSRF